MIREGYWGRLAREVERESDAEEVKTNNLKSFIASTLKCSATEDFEYLRAAIKQISSVQDPSECEQMQIIEPAAEPAIPASVISKATEDDIPGGEARGNLRQQHIYIDNGSESASLLQTG